jgi:DNA-binding NarL/FixJ family response regulator
MSHTRVEVIGPGSITRQLIALILTRDVDDSPDPGALVLVDPESGHWADALTHHLPIVLILSEPVNDEVVTEAVLRGAEAVLNADIDTTTLRAAIDDVAAGATLLEPHQVRRVIDTARRALASGGTGPTNELSGRELEILQSIARGDSVKQTAISLGIRPKTVENVQSRLFRKLGVRNRAQAVSRAYSIGLFSD